MDNRIKIIRDEERKYHEACYDNYKLFEEGSWLSKPVKTVCQTIIIIGVSRLDNNIYYFKSIAI
ncbi:hypothetical protein QFZ77_004941 [Paenibacillus sp. V4I3]|nr:hypothetical protein [Paenibacillus sp. V4I3]MDQ0887686.1 hypothetical protein [Paenibacillus sp. V4I9]